MATASRPALTRQQELAVATRDVSVALSAGAGCGKTHVLVERYLSHLAPDSGDPGRDSAALGELIAITFTDRAAREMRDRVRRTCRERLQGARSEAEAHAWLSLLRDLEAARISTIHAFCAALLRFHAVEAGIDPRFAILQPAQSATLFSELMDDQMRDELGRRNEDLIELAVMYGLTRLRDMIQDVSARRHAIDFAAWADVTPDELVERWQHFEREQILPAVRDEFLSLPEIAEIRTIVGAWQPEYPKLRERFAALSGALSALDQGANLLEILPEIRENAQVQGATRKHWHSDEVYARFRDAAAGVRKWIDEIAKSLPIDRESALPSAAAGLALLRVARPVSAAFEERKRAEAMLDFNDLLTRARDLLLGPHGPALRKQLSSRLVLLLVDEFQDTDPLQVELVEILCGDGLAGGKLFFVGDAKQSIYRFRGADPGVFRKLRERIPQAGRLPLTKNFRSQPAVLDFVNALFCERLGPGYEPLEPNRQPLSSQSSIEFLWATLAPDPDVKPDAAALRRVEADWIARRLAGMFAAGDVIVQDKATRQGRPAQAGDVAILFRALSDVQFYETALRQYQIPYYLVGGSAFYAQQEVFDLLNLLRALNTPSDEISLAGALRSPFFSLADETLFWLAQHRDGLAAGLFDERTPPELEEPQRERVRFAARTLAELRAKKDRLPIAGLIGEALARTGYDALLVAEFLGPRKLANLRKLIDQARGFDASGLFTLADYIHQVAEFVARQPDEPPAPIEPESSTVVRLMTIHQAKGLEFPVVVVPDMARKLSGPKDDLAFDPELGPLVRARAGSDRAGSCGLDLYRYRERQEEADEEIRLLYVAATRAADYLILSAGLKAIDKPGGRWLELVADRFDIRSGALKGSIPAGYGQPRVIVTLEAPPVSDRISEGGGRPDLAAIAAAARDCAAAGQGVVPELVAPLAADLAARNVYSFSRLAARFALADARPEDPLSLPTIDAEPLTGEPASDATELGKLVHAVLAQIDFSGGENVAARCRRELARNFAASTIDPATAATLVERFLRSKRADELRSARVVHRELEFLLAWPPDRSDDGPMIQGFIDCLYHDGQGRWHVLDYKTNRVTAADVPRAAAAYEMQMLLYALAAEEVLGTSPASLVLCFLQPGVECAFAWTPQAREKAAAIMQAALANAGQG